MPSTLAAIVFTLVLVAGVPALSYSTARNTEIRNLPRLGLYLSAVVSQWLLTVVALGVVYVIARQDFAQCFGPTRAGPAVEWAVGAAAASILALGMVALGEKRGWLPRETELVYLLIPQSPREKVWAVVILAPTAGFCEEFLFRGYLLAQMHTWLHSLVWAAVASSVAFGLAHFYQGWSGMSRAALLGMLLAYIVIRCGSLYPAMLAHWMIDTAALVWLGPWMMDGNDSAEGRLE